jgi:hypothetical protein
VCKSLRELAIICAVPQSLKPAENKSEQQRLDKSTQPLAPARRIAHCVRSAENTCACICAKLRLSTKINNRPPQFLAAVVESAHLLVRGSKSWTHLCLHSTSPFTFFSQLSVTGSRKRREHYAASGQLAPLPRSPF